MKSPILLLFVFCWLNFKAQQTNFSTPENAIWQLHENDTTSIKLGKIHFLARNYISTTINFEQLNDYFTNAQMLGMRYQSPLLWKRFHLTTSGSISKNLFSSDLSVKDSLSGTFSRYELTLFDMNPDNYRTFFIQLEEFNFRYHLKNWQWTLGNHYLNNPLLNPQDARLRPTIFSGISAEHLSKRNWRISTSFLLAASPRSTFNWYSIGNSMGTYSQGVQSDGLPYAYQNKVKTSGIYVLGIQSPKNEKRGSGQFWNYWIENVMNTTYTDFHFRLNQSLKHPLVISGQALFQFATSYRSVANYTPSNFKSFTYGLQLEQQFESFKIRLAANHITKMGQFLFPREFGREPLFTFIPRERQEGLADVKSVLLGLMKSFKNLQIESRTGMYWTPKYNDFEHNKYGTTSFLHTALMVNYNLTRKVPELQISMTTLLKKPLSDEPIPLKYIANRVNMFYTALVINYSVSPTKFKKTQASKSN